MRSWGLDEAEPAADRGVERGRDRDRHRRVPLGITGGERFHAPGRHGLPDLCDRGTRGRVPDGLLPDPGPEPRGATKARRSRPGSAATTSTPEGIGPGGRSFAVCSARVNHPGLVCVLAIGGNPARVRTSPRRGGQNGRLRRLRGRGQVRWARDSRSTRGSWLTAARTSPACWAAARPSPLTRFRRSRPWAARPVTRAWRRRWGAPRNRARRRSWTWGAPTSTWPAA